MEHGHIKVIMRVTALPGEDVLLEHQLRALMPPTLEEAGCISCELLRHQLDRTEFVLIEVWEDNGCADAHFESPHFKQTLTDTQELLACIPDIRRYGIVKDKPLNA